jgi:itaconate CoA-transferase
MPSGHFSLRTNNDYASTVLRHCDRVIVEVNKNMPRVFGDSLVHISEVNAVVENHVPLVQIPYRTPDEEAMKIGKFIADQIPDGATLQLGIGNLPNAVALHLSNRNDLGIHSELFSDAFVELVRSGVANGRKKTIHPRKHVFTFSIGDDEVYQFINDNPSMESYASCYVNDIHIIAKHDNLMSVNTAIEIDLYGQVKRRVPEWRPVQRVWRPIRLCEGRFLFKGWKIIHRTEVLGKKWNHFFNRS